MKNTFVFVAAVAAGCVCAQDGTYTPSKTPFECFCHSVDVPVPALEA